MAESSRRLRRRVTKKEVEPVEAPVVEKKEEKKDVRGEALAEMHEHRVKQSETKAPKAVVELEAWYEILGADLVKKVKKDGSVYTRVIARAKKAGLKIADLKKRGLLK